MSESNPAQDAQPGQAFTDPKAGKWVIFQSPFGVLGSRWWYASADGKEYGCRTQEQAEEANLTRMVPEVAVMDQRVVAWNRIADHPVFNLCYREEGPLIDAMMDRLDQIGRDEKAEEARVFAQRRLERNPQMIAAIQRAEQALEDGQAVEVEVDPVFGLRDDEVPAPSPLDPDNPDDLRRVAALLDVVIEDIGANQLRASVSKTKLHLRLVADRLDRERAEKAQDVEDRELADKITAAWKLNEDAHAAHLESVLAGIRAADARAAGGAS